MVVVGDGGIGSWAWGRSGWGLGWGMWRGTTWRRVAPLAPCGVAYYPPRARPRAARPSSRSGSIPPTTRHRSKPWHRPRRGCRSLQLAQCRWSVAVRAWRRRVALAQCKGGVVGGRQWGVPACEESAGRVRVGLGWGGTLLRLLVCAGPPHPRWSRLALIGSWSVPTPRTATTRSAQASGRPGVEPVPWPTLCQEGCEEGRPNVRPPSPRRVRCGRFCSARKRYVTSASSSAPPSTYDT